MMQQTASEQGRRRQSTTLKLDREARSILGQIAKFEDLPLSMTAKRVFKEAANKRKISFIGGSA